MVIIVLSLLLFASLCILAIVYQKYQSSKKRYKKETYWYASLLDAIPFPISVTDNDMNWTFVNKPVETMFGKKRSEFIGKQCSNWGAKICNTDNCGIRCLKRNVLKTFFEQSGAEFQVDINNIYDEAGKKSGHIEIVQDITKTVEITKKQEALIKNVTSACVSLAKLAAELAANSNKLASGTDDQTATIEEIVATVGEIASLTKENSRDLDSTTEKTEKAAKVIQKSNHQMEDLIAAMTKINDTSQQINMIITTIEDIASQTNLLSLNASIEAARAGEAGRGFAIVADQIGQLASQSAEAAKNTKQLIETTINAINNGNNITSATAESLKIVVNSINEIKDSSKNINKAISKQADVMLQIDQALHQIAKVVQDNSIVAGDNSNTSHMLSVQAQSLQDIVNQ